MTREELPLWAACLAAEVLAGSLVALLGRRDRPLLLLTSLVSLYVVADLAIAVAGWLVLDATPRPYRGLARALYHLETALLLAQPFFTAALAHRLFAWPKEAARAVNVLTVAWLLTSGAFAVVYPLPRGWTSHALHVAMLGPALVGLGVAHRARRRPWGRAHVLVLLLLGMLLAIGVIGPFVRNNPYDDWKFARISGVIGFGAVAAFCAAWLGGWTWKAPSSPSERSSRSP